MSNRLNAPVESRVKLPTLHADQTRAFHALRPHPYKVLRCGRRWGKTDYAKTWIGDGAIKGEPCGWFAPDYKIMSEAYNELVEMLEPVILRSSKTEGVIRLTTGGRIDFWTLDNERAGRSRKYKKIGVDEGAFTNDDTMEGQWEQAIKPTLLDLEGEALVCSNTNGNDPKNFMYKICNDPRFGFVEYHAPTWGNPLLPLRKPSEAEGDWKVRRKAALQKLLTDNHPLVFQQEFKADFVDWSGIAFFALPSLLVNNLPVAAPSRCHTVFAVVDSAAKTGTENDGTAVMYFATIPGNPQGYELVIVDWDISQIEGALLETWLPTVFKRLEELAKLCGARRGSSGALIEDKTTGMVLIQQAARRNWPATAIDSKLTAVGKDERAISMSGYVYRGQVKFTKAAYDKTTTYKGTTRNHAVAQIVGFRIADKDARKRQDDLLDTFCYGVAVSLGNAEGF